MTACVEQRSVVLLGCLNTISHLFLIIYEPNVYKRLKDGALIYTEFTISKCVVLSLVHFPVGLSRAFSGQGCGKFSIL